MSFASRRDQDLGQDHHLGHGHHGRMRAHRRHTRPQSLRRQVTAGPTVTSNIATTAANIITTDTTTTITHTARKDLRAILQSSSASASSPSIRPHSQLSSASSSCKKNQIHHHHHPSPSRQGLSSARMLVLCCYCSMLWLMSSSWQSLLPLSSSGLDLGLGLNPGLSSGLGLFGIGFAEATPAPAQIQRRHPGQVPFMRPSTSLPESEDVLNDAEDNHLMYRRPLVSSPEESQLSGKFLHITDIHPDEHYVNGGTISSSCHRLASDTNKMMRPGRTEGGIGGVYGSSFSICDSPFALANATFDWIDKNLIGTIDFVVWTGDNARHDSDNEYPRTQKEIEDLNRMIANKFRETFTPDEDDPFQQRIPIVPSIGNNDVYPHNIMEAGPNRILQHFSEIWADFIPESEYHTFQHGGYYISEVIPGKTSVVALNTLYFFNQNAAVDGCDTENEPGTDQMDWLEVELESLRRRKMTAYLTGHVPPARKSYSVTCYRRYTAIALKFQDVIVGHMFGHANIDHFFILSQATLKGSEAMEQEPTDDSRMLHSNNRTRSSTAKEFEKTVSGLGQGGMMRGLTDRLDMANPAHDPVYTSGLSSYLIDLWDQYENIPKNAKDTDYAIAFVAPSVIPTYNPGLRVISYQLARDTPTSSVSPLQQQPEPWNKDSIMDFSEATELYESQDMFAPVEVETNNKGKGRKKPKPRRPPNPPAVLPTQFGFPLNYTQYWVNITNLNLETEAAMAVLRRGDGPVKMPTFDYEVDVPQLLSLARRIVKETALKELYLSWMVVLTGTENEP
ncbi:Endopolyphosphatase [Lunasporangiospora selenospora]|uniref:Endopolyphosphatase n=1 Tax=Lunasporangiospora selenospora TaxID=979761 RepID=A0A9P6FX60_9FUNG|nr:Endopolyphosphatase [Lunasporangiospora selenospora]